MLSYNRILTINIQSPRPLKQITFLNFKYKTDTVDKEGWKSTKYYVQKCSVTFFIPILINAFQPEIYGLRRKNITNSILKNEACKKNLIKYIRSICLEIGL